jgi:hypothetical protein
MSGTADFSTIAHAEPARHQRRPAPPEANAALFGVEPVGNPVHAQVGSVHHAAAVAHVLLLREDAGVFPAIHYQRVHALRG